MRQVHGRTHYELQDELCVSLPEKIRKYIVIIVSPIRRTYTNIPTVEGYLEDSDVDATTTPKTEEGHKIR